MSVALVIVVTTPASAPVTPTPHPNSFGAIIHATSHSEAAYDSVGISVGAEYARYRAKDSQDQSTYDVMEVQLNMMANSRGDFPHSQITSYSFGVVGVELQEIGPMYWTSLIAYGNGGDDRSAKASIASIAAQCTSEVTTGISFYGVHYNDVWVSENGYISVLGPPASPFVPNPGIPSEKPPNGFIAPFYKDLKITSPSEHVWGYCATDDPDASWDDEINVGFEWKVQPKLGLGGLHWFGVQFGCSVMATGHGLRCDRGLHFWYVSAGGGTQPTTIGMENEGGTAGVRWTTTNLASRRLSLGAEDGAHRYLSELKMTVEKVGGSVGTTALEIDQKIHGTDAVGGRTPSLLPNRIRMEETRH